MELTILTVSDMDHVELESEIVMMILSVRKDCHVVLTTAVEPITCQVMTVANVSRTYTVCYIKKWGKTFLNLLVPSPSSDQCYEAFNFQQAPIQFLSVLFTILHAYPVDTVTKLLFLYYKRDVRNKLLTYLLTYSSALKG